MANRHYYKKKKTSFVKCYFVNNFVPHFLEMSTEPIIDLKQSLWCTLVWWTRGEIVVHVESPARLMTTYVLSIVSLAKNMSCYASNVTNIE